METKYLMLTGASVFVMSLFGSHDASAPAAPTSAAPAPTTSNTGAATYADAAAMPAAPSDDRPLLGALVYLPRDEVDGIELRAGFSIAPRCRERLFMNSSLGRNGRLESDNDCVKELIAAFQRQFPELVMPPPPPPPISRTRGGRRQPLADSTHTCSSCQRGGATAGPDSNAKVDESR